MNRRYLRPIVLGVALAALVLVPESVAGLEGPSFTYAYTDDEGVTRTGLALAVTSQNTGLSYLIIVQAIDTEFGSQSETFTAILNSMQIE